MAQTVQDGPARIVHLAKMSTAADFFAAYQPGQANAQDSTGRTVLLAALGNTDLSARSAIANRLLDDGADPTAVSGNGATTLHVLLGHVRHDIAAETPVLRRLLDGGADRNAVMPKFGTPLQTLLGMFQLTDEQLAPFYDEIFARPGLDLLTVAGRSSPLTSARKARTLRAGLLARMEAYLRAHDIEIPPEET